MGKCSPKHVYKGIQLCKGSQDALDAVVPLELAFEWYEAYIHTCSYEKFFMVAAKNKKTTTTTTNNNNNKNKMCRAIPSAQPKMLYHTGQG